MAGRDIDLGLVVPVVPLRAYSLPSSTAALTWPRGSGRSASRSQPVPRRATGSSGRRRSCRDRPDSPPKSCRRRPTTTTARPPLRESGSRSPGIRVKVVFPHLGGDRPGVLPLEPAREPDSLPARGRVEVGQSRWQILLPRPGVGCRILPSMTAVGDATRANGEGAALRHRRADSAFPGGLATGGSAVQAASGMFTATTPTRGRGAEPHRRDPRPAIWPPLNSQPRHGTTIKYSDLTL